MVIGEDRGEHNERDYLSAIEILDPSACTYPHDVLIIDAKGGDAQKCVIEFQKPPIKWQSFGEWNLHDSKPYVNLRVLFFFIIDREADEARCGSLSDEPGVFIDTLVIRVAPQLIDHRAHQVTYVGNVHFYQLLRSELHRPDNMRSS